MPQKKSRSKETLRHNEYYNIQNELDDLYRDSQLGKAFDNLMDIILSNENVELAYRNIKANKGSHTPGTDQKTIDDIAKMSPEEVVKKVKYIVLGSQHGYRPKPVRRKEIPKANGKTRPLGIPCIWDRLIQQCILQIIEPICEAKFSDNSYGFRPNRCVEHAIAETHRLLQKSKCRYVVEFDIEGFFDNVNHSKLIKQLWSIGIHDKTLLFVIKRILKAPIRMPDGTTIIPTKGTPQGGIISPILANIVLNELDNWIDSQWLENPFVYATPLPKNRSGTTIKSNAYAKMRQTKLKEIYIIRYADDFRVFCKSRETAEATRIAVTDWIEKRLKLKVSEEKTRIVNVSKRYMEFLGFKLKLYKRGGKWVVKSHVCDKKLKEIEKNLTTQLQKLWRAKNKSHAGTLINRYNAMVLGIQNYFEIATEIAKDLRKVQYQVNVTLKTRFHGTHKKKGKFAKSGRKLTLFERERYGSSKALRYYKSGGEPLYPIGYPKIRPPLSKNKKSNSFSPEGRAGIHNQLKIDMSLLIEMMRTPIIGKSLEYNDNRLSLFSSQRGKCAVTQRMFTSCREIHCHHKIPRFLGGSDKYENLTLVSEEIHKLIHASKPETISKYMESLSLTEYEVMKLNKLRQMAGQNPILLK